MTPVAESEVVRVVRGFKAAILAREAAQMAVLADRYLELERSLEDQIAALVAQVSTLEDEGRATYWAIQKLETYQRYQLKMLTALDEYNAWAAENIRQEQLTFAGLGQEHAAATLNTAKPGIAVPLSSAERERIVAMVGFASDGSPLATLLSASGDLVRATVTQKLIEAVTKGQNPRVTAREIRKGTGMALNRALAISRTEQLRVYRETTAASYRASGIQYYQRLAARDPATCIACLSMDGEISTSDASVDDHVNGRCVVPGTLAAGPVPLAATSRKYVGEVVTIRVASGHLATVTPNHPILTDRGWVAAGLLREGDNVISGNVLQRESALVNPHEYQMPTRIEQIRDTLGMTRLVQMPTAAEDFHGDGAGSEVHVVWTTGDLRNRLDPAFGQQGGHIPLVWGYAAWVRLIRDRALALLCDSLFSRGAHFVHECGEFLSAFGAHLLADDAVRLCYATSGDASYAQAGAYDLSRYTEREGERVLGFSSDVARDNLGVGDAGVRTIGGGTLRGGEFVSLGARAEQAASLERIREGLLGSVESLGDNLRAFAGNVVTDRVLEISSRAFRGHVYNLQTEPGWYIADSIVSHNCTSVPIVPGAENPMMEPSQSWFDRQGEETQRAMMGDARYTLYQSGQAKWSDLGEHKHDAVWGDSVAVVPVKDLAAAKTVAA